MIDIAERKRVKLKLRKEALAQLEFHRDLKAGPWTKLIYLWSTTPSDCKCALILEFLFQPHDFKVRYDQELYFQYKLSHRQWR